jgi:hypothetical protein
MTRAVACLLLLLLPLLAPVAQADAGRAVTVWDSDRVITSGVEVLKDDTLEIPAGVNITFDAENTTGAGEDMPSLYVAGGLEVCGTALRPVRFNSTPMLWELFGEPDCIFLYRNNTSGALSVRNASFTDIVLAVINGSGEFCDCRFDRCEVDIHFSAVRFINCTFIFSSVTNDRYVFDRHSSQVLFRNCRFEAYGSGSHPPIWKYGEDYNKEAQYFGEAAIEDRGGAMVEDCTVTGYSSGIVSGFGFTSVSGCDISHCMNGMSLWSDYPEDIATVRDCTVTGCSATGIMVSESVRLSNCTISGCENGVWLYSYGNAVSVIEGNSIYNNSMFGMVIYGKEAVLSSNFFGNGSSANGWGILLKRNYTMVRVTDPLGNPVKCRLNWTDAQGNSGVKSIDGSWPLEVLEYSLANSGERIDHLPYTLNAELAGRTNRTTFEGGYYNVTLVLSVLTDLAAINLSVNPERPAAGERAAFSIRLENLGYYSGRDGSVSFVLDGREMDRQEIPLLKGGLTETVYSKDWNAKAGRHSLRVVLDPDGNISESDRSNNGMAINFTVEKAPAADFRDRASTCMQLVLIIGVMALVVVGRFRRRKSMPVAGPASSNVPTVR